MAPPRKYSAELRERAVRMVFELREQIGEKTGTIARVADQLGVHREALRTSGSGRPRSMAASVRAPRPATRKGSPSWNARTVSCDGPTKS
jgi:transposase-like protein